MIFILPATNYDRETEKIPTLTEEAHEVIDLRRQATTEVLNKLHGAPSSESIERYLGVIEWLR